MTNTDESSLTAVHDKGHSVPYLRLLPKTEKQKVNKPKDKKNNGKTDTNEFYLILYKSLLKDGVINNYEDFLFYCFVNQREIRRFIDSLGFTSRDKGGASE